MKTKSLFFLLFFAIMLQGNINAQFRNALKNAINKSINNKADSAAAKNQKEHPEDNTATSGGSKESGRGLFGGKMDIKYNDEYKFTGRIYMQMESYDKNKVQVSDFYTYFNPDTKSAGIEVKPLDVKEGENSVPAQFLFDSDNRCFIILMESNDSKTGIISTLPSDSAIAAKSKSMNEASKEKTEKPENQPTITKTGRSRVIAGYKCDEYKITEQGKEEYANVWMTKDVKINADKKYWGKAGMPTYYNYPGFEGSMMLAMESFDKNDKPVAKMETKEINDKFDHSISTVGYTFMKMNFGSAGKK